jgi:hypothetical protein
MAGTAKKEVKEQPINSMTIWLRSTGKTLIATVKRHAYSLPIQIYDAPDTDKTEVWENARPN